VTTRSETAAATYDAENQLRDILDIADREENRAYRFYESTFTLPIERKFASIESIETYCNMVLQLPQVRRKYPEMSKIPVTVRHRRGDRMAHYEQDNHAIAICTKGTRWALRELVVLHELAHHLTPYNGHAVRFRKAHTFLCGECIGPEIGLILAVFYDKNFS
jgi:putative metallohydrolase (TIGR04338 family)